MPSTVITKYYYEESDHSLIVVFISGMVYRYLDVPEEAYQKMKRAVSKGTFLNKFIKGKYEFIKEE